MTVLRAALFNILFFGYTTLIALWLLPQLLARNGDVAPGIQHWIAGILWLLEHVVGITYELRGAENVPAGPAIVASKHQSAWDTMMFHRFVRSPAYVVKKELMRIPLYGTYTRMSGSIVVDRKGGARALKDLVRNCRAALEADRQIVIFPEGTRTAPGVRQPYQPGVAALYHQLGVAVVPVALNSGLYWGRRSFVKRPGRILVEFLPAIPPGLGRKQFLARLEERVESASAALMAEAAMDNSGG